MHPKSLRQLTREARQRTGDRSVRVQILGYTFRLYRAGQPVTPYLHIEAAKAALEALQ